MPKLDMSTDKRCRLSTVPIVGCRNITAVIASQCELGKEPVFWQNETGLALSGKA